MLPFKEKHFICFLNNFKMYLSSPLAGHDVWVGDGVGDGNISGRRVKAHSPILTKQTFENIIISIIDYLSMLMATK